MTERKLRRSLWEERKENREESKRKQTQFLIPKFSFLILGRKRPRRTLKTAQEETFRIETTERKIPVRSEVVETHKSGYHSISIVLGME